MNSSSAAESIPMILRKNVLFSSLSNQQLQELVAFIKIIQYDTGAMIICENAHSVDLYIILEGEIAITKNTGKEEKPRILGAAEIIVEIGFLNNAPDQTNIRTLKPCKLLVMSITDLNRIAKKNVFYNPIIRKPPIPMQKKEHYYNEQIYAAMFSHLVQILQNHIPRAGQFNTLRMELEQQRKMKETMGRFIVTLFVLLVSYIYVFSIFKSITATEHIPRGFISLPVIFIFSACILRLIKTSGYPWAFYGLTTHNWKPACKDALFFSTLFIIMLIGLKWLAIHLIPALSVLPQKSHLP